MDYTRQRDWFDPDRTNAAATIVGCGGIGSFTAFALAKLGVQRLTLLDRDVVDEHNVPNQMFAETLIGLPKVGALAGLINSWDVGRNPDRITPLYQDLNDGVPLSPVVISALDSMKARAELWQQVRMKPACKLFLDGRLGGQHIVLYAVNPTLPSDVAAYEATLHSDSEGLDLPCTAKSVIDVGFAIASLITRAVRLHYSHAEIPRMTYYNVETLTIHQGGWA